MLCIVISCSFRILHYSKCCEKANYFCSVKLLNPAQNNLSLLIKLSVMKKQFLISVVFIFTSSICLAQNAHKWNLANKALEYPKRVSLMKVASASIDNYDTVVCQYKRLDSQNIFIGYKLVFKKDGFYIDDDKTLNVFFDERKKRVEKVS